MREEQVGRRHQLSGVRKLQDGDVNVDGQSKTTPAKINKYCNNNNGTIFFSVYLQYISSQMLLHMKSGKASLYHL